VDCEAKPLQACYAAAAEHTCRALVFGVTSQHNDVTQDFNA